jgi:hypothetical protein
MRPIIITLVAVAAFTHVAGARAMQVSAVGHQLILSGPVVGDELGKVQAILAENPAIDTAILRNSPGGHAPTGYHIGELFRARGLRTAVSGFCNSSCSRMFLGGKARFFTDDFPPEYTNVGFHGHYDNKGRLTTDAVKQLGLRDWIIKYSDGKADSELVDRWISIPLSIGMIHFYHPERFARDGASTFMCQGSEPMARSVNGCEPIFKTALDLGIVTSLNVVKSEDQVDVRALLPDRPKASGFAAIEDIGKVPLSSDHGRREYESFLAAPLPRAMALSVDGLVATWKAGEFAATRLALQRCEQPSGRPCKLYAVDNDVVWNERP